MGDAQAMDGVKRLSQNFTVDGGMVVLVCVGWVRSVGVGVGVGVIISNDILVSVSVSVGQPPWYDWGYP